MTVRMAALACIVIALIVMACGGGDGDQREVPLTVSEYFDRNAELRSELNNRTAEALEALRAQADSGQDQRTLSAKTLGDVESVYEDIRDATDDLVPPTEFSEGHDQMVDVLTDMAAIYGGLRESVIKAESRAEFESATEVAVLALDEFGTQLATYCLEIVEALGPTGSEHRCTLEGTLFEGVADDQ